MPINTQQFGNSQAHSENAQRDDGSVTHQQEGNIRSAELQRYLEGVRFPANKHDLVEHAMEHQAPNRIVDLLNQLQTPEFGSGNSTKLTLYNNLDELLREIDRIG